MEGKLHAAGLGERSGQGLNGSTGEQGPSKEKFIRAIVSTLRTYPKGYASEQELLADLFDDHQIDAMAMTRKLRYDRFCNFLSSDECANYVRCMEKSNGKMVYQAMDVGKCSLPGAAAAKVQEEKDKTVTEKINALNLYDGNVKAGDKLDGHRHTYSDQKKLSLLITDDYEQPGEEIDSEVSNNSSSIPPINDWYITPSKHQPTDGGNGSGGEVVKRRDPYPTIQDVAWPNYRDEGDNAKKMIDRTEGPIIAMKPIAGHVVKEKDHDAKLAMVICSIVEYSFPRYLLLDDLLVALKLIDPRSSFPDGSRIDEFLTTYCQQVKVVSEGSHKHLIWNGDH